MKTGISLSKHASPIYFANDGGGKGRYDVYRQDTVRMMMDPWMTHPVRGMFARMPAGQQTITEKNISFMNIW